MAENIPKKYPGVDVPSNRTEFLDWFWKRNNGNDLIRDLNKYAIENKLSDRIRRERVTERPSIYGLVINDKRMKFYSDKSGKKTEWTYVKIGFTHKDTTQGTGNRMETVVDKIKKTGYENVSTLFVLSVSCVDTTPFFETEDRIRKKVGTCVKKEIAKGHKLPVPTEWVFASQEHLSKILMKIKSNEGNLDRIDIFKGIEKPPKVPEDLIDKVE
ncbi:uncharacterized protein LOC134261347 [Saccostrea cucullata]|uniref:uncharacterized protein LOC134261347 n=1 Tax=Saccostrea cuccullata TaxID=36930 RepID=UPI002ED172E1